MIKELAEGAEYNVLQIPPGAYEQEILNAEIKRNNINERYITKEDYPFTIRPNFSDFPIYYTNRTT